MDLEQLTILPPCLAVFCAVAAANGLVRAVRAVAAGSPRRAVWRWLAAAVGGAIAAAAMWHLHGWLRDQRL